MVKAFEKMDFKPDVLEGVYFDDVSVTYCQNEDCTQNMDEVQTLTISSRNNGIGRFINIKTESWSISDFDELKEVLEDFIKRAEIEFKKDDNKGN